MVRAHVDDNASWEVVRYTPTFVEYQLDGGPLEVVPMFSFGAQVFRGEIPGTPVGTVNYRVRSTDEHGNTAVSTAKS